MDYDYGQRTICAGFPSSVGFGAGGWSHSNFLASSVPGCSGDLLRGQAMRVPGVLYGDLLEPPSIFAGRSLPM